MLDGYGKGWSEPKAVGRWARFLQIMREPATRDDALLAFAFIPFALLAFSAIALIFMRHRQ